MDTLDCGNNGALCWPVAAQREQITALKAMGFLTVQLMPHDLKIVAVTPCRVASRLAAGMIYPGDRVALGARVKACQAGDSR